MVNFNIVEQDTSKKEYYEYEELIRLYNKGLKTQEIMDTIGLTKYKYNKHKQEALSEGRIRSRQDMRNPKYYYKTSTGHYQIIKIEPKSKKRRCYGTYNTEEDVRNRVDELIKNNWRD